MKNERTKRMCRSFIKYMQETMFNKIAAIVLIGVALLFDIATGWITDGASTLMALLFGLPIFFAKKDVLGLEFR